MTHGPRVIRISHSAGYQVVGLPDLSPTFRVRAEAEKWLRARLAALPESRRPRERPCLCCGRRFESEGIHNRLCNPCRGSDRLPLALGSIGASSGKVRFAARS